MNEKRKKTGESNFLALSPSWTGTAMKAAHLSSDGSKDMVAIMKAFYDIGFEGPVRPDHGRTIWGETSIPGYGLYDRALGLCYLSGLLEAINKNVK